MLIFINTKNCNYYCWIISVGDQRIIRNVKITYYSFLPRLNKGKKKTVDIDSAVSIGCQGKYMKYGSFLWPPLEAALPIFNVIFFCSKTIFEEELVKTKETANNATI